MVVSQKKAVGRHRERQKRKGLVRVEVQVPRDDATRLRALAELLRGADENLARRARQALGAAAAVGPTRSAKDLLAAMPEGIPLDFPRGGARKVEL